MFEIDSKAKKKGDLASMLDMMLHIADTNAAEVRNKRRQTGNLVTSAFLEKLEWNAFKARLTRRSKLLRSGKVATLDGDSADCEEDDVDLLLGVVAVLERTKGESRTLSEIARALQTDRVLSIEFPAGARAQTQRLLTKLRDMSRVYQDEYGRWALL